MKVFKEEQRFRQIWLIVIIIFSSLITMFSFFYADKEGGKINSVEELLWLILLILIPLALIYFFKLSTKIDDYGIHYQFFPFHFSTKTITWNEVSKIYVRTYSPILEFGGWGLKGGFFWSKKGKAINVSGDIGIQLEFKNGKKLLVGTQKETQAKSILETYQNKIQ